MKNPSKTKAASKPAVDAESIRAGIDDPLEAVKAISDALREAAEVEDPEAAFIRYIKAWAEHNNVTRDALREYGVKASVLNKAFGTAPKTSSSRRRSSGTRVNVESLTQAITSKPVGTSLTIAAVADELGGSIQTIRKVLDQLAEIGTLTALGPDPDHSGQGRAPHVWERV